LNWQTDPLTVVKVAGVAA